jgi:hypothetical protein
VNSEVAAEKVKFGNLHWDCISFNYFSHQACLTSTF